MWFPFTLHDHSPITFLRFSSNQHHRDIVYRLTTHACAVTCVRYGKMEVLSGDVKGRIFIWWMTTGKVIGKSDCFMSRVAFAIVYV
jgi:hypothetical protein